VDAIKKPLPPQNHVYIALDGCKSAVKLARMVVIGYDIDQNCALGEFQHALHEVDWLFISTLEH
jgi:hypothetical protein